MGLYLGGGIPVAPEGAVGEGGVEFADVFSLGIIGLVEAPG